MKILFGTIAVALIFAPNAPAQQSPVANPQLNVECSAEAVQDGFRLHLSGKTGYPEGTILETAVSRKRLFDIDASIYTPNELVERIGVKEGGKIDATMNIPGNFFLPGRYAMRIAFDPESQIERVKKILAAKGMKMEYRNEVQEVVIRDVERTLKCLQEDLRDFIAIVTSIDKANGLFKKLLAQEVRQKEDMESLLKIMADVERIRRKSENHTYTIFAYAQVDLFFGFIPRISLSGEIPKPPHTLEEEKAMEKTNLKLRAEEKENEVIKPDDPLVPLVQITERIRSYFIAELSAEIVMECDIMLAELCKEFKNRESWDRRKKGTASELERLSKLVEELERSTFGSEVSSNFSMEGSSVVRKAVDAVAAAVATTQKKIDKEGRMDKDDKDLTEAQAKYEELKNGSRVYPKSASPISPKPISPSKNGA